MSRIFTFAVLAMLGLLGIPTALLGQDAPITLSLKPAESGIKIPSTFTGFSFETSSILPDKEGSYSLFRPSNEPLITLFHTLGVKSLRIGGNTSDRPTVKVPDNADIDNLFAFTRLAGLKVIYTLRLRDWEPSKDTPIAKYLMSQYGGEISCLAIGNEPNMYDKPYAKYAEDTKRYFTAITTPGVAPNAKFCGPATTPNAASWAGSFTRTFGKSVPLQWITQHSYPASYGKLTDDLAAERLKLLSPELTSRDETLYASFVPEVVSAGLQYRIEEVNSDYRNGGTAGVSNSFASALWALNYLYWWAAHGSQGVNFHTGDTVAANGGERHCFYAVFSTVPDGYQVHPLGYAIKAFDLTSHGTLVPLHLSSPVADVAAYAVRAKDGAMYITLIDKARDSKAHSHQIVLDLDRPYSSTESMLLQSPHGSLAATEGITLGGALIRNNGKWNGKWSYLKMQGGHVILNLIPDTALLVRLKP